MFHWKIAYISAITAITGFDSGSTTDQRNRRSLAPSRTAASYRSSGMVERKNVRAMITCQTPIALGITIAQRVFSMPRSWTTRYVGIRPPENSMVKISTLMITLRPKNVLRDNG